MQQILIKANSYKAENERLKEENNDKQDRCFGLLNLCHKYRNKLKIAKDEAYKEVLEKVREILHNYFIELIDDDLDNLLKKNWWVN